MSIANASETGTEQLLSELLAEVRDLRRVVDDFAALIETYRPLLDRVSGSTAGPLAWAARREAKKKGKP